ncbi:MAG: hypothetical protein ACFFAE_04980 [Candidatus Hodarchaeota archaeon]
MNSSKINQLRFYDGRKHPIETERLLKFEIQSVIDRFYYDRVVDAITVIDDFGSIHLDYSNIQLWSKEIPDIDERSARLFIIWAEEEKSKNVVLILRGFFILVPFKFGKEALKGYHYDYQSPCYPMAIVTSFRTTITNIAELSELIDRVKQRIELNWRNIRQQVIDTLDKTELWERYVLSLEKLTYFSFLCPSTDRELIEALKRQNYRTTGFLRILASPTPSYDEIMIKSHVSEAKKLIEKHKHQ